MKQIITPDQASQWTDFLLFGLVVKLRNFVGGGLFREKSLSVTLNAPHKREKDETSDILGKWRNKQIKQLGVEFMLASKE